MEAEGRAHSAKALADLQDLVDALAKALPRGNRLKGCIGDVLHATLCGAGHNLRMILMAPRQPCSRRVTPVARAVEQNPTQSSQSTWRPVGFDSFWARQIWSASTRASNRARPPISPVSTNLDATPI